MPFNVLLECEASDHAAVLADLDTLVNVITQVVGLGFTPESPDAGYVQAPTDEIGVLGQQTLYYLPGTIDVMPEGGTVVGLGWTIRIFHDAAIDSPTHMASVASHTASDVVRELALGSFALKCALGQGVAIGIVDAGINLAHLTTVLAAPQLDAGLSVIHPKHPSSAGMSGIGHGTMCAYDALIAAPQSCLLDLACLTNLSLGDNKSLVGLLSRIHRVLLMLDYNLPALRDKFAGIVLSNSWAVSDASADWPTGHPANYLSNPVHPFNRTIARLDRRGVDVVFAAGNCANGGPQGNCIPDGACGAIYGANSHPGALTVGAVDLTRTPLPASSEGPGRLHGDKPDIAAFANFVGSKLTSKYFIDGQTSAACAVAAGVVAAIRSRRPSSYTSLPQGLTPAALRQKLTSTAGGPFNRKTGFGVINGSAIAAWL